MLNNIRSLLSGLWALCGHFPSADAPAERAAAQTERLAPGPYRLVWDRPPGSPGW
jgi:hypothetical protein